MPPLLGSVDLIELAALATAISALGATIWQARIAREHNRLSVRPVLTLHRNEAEGYIELKNSGFGPALVQEYEVYLSGTQIDLSDMSDVLPVEFIAPEIKVGAAIAAGASIMLVRVITPHASCVEPMQNLNFRVEYQSIYGETRTLE